MALLKNKSYLMRILIFTLLLGAINFAFAQDVFTSNGAGADYNTAANWAVVRDLDNAGTSTYPGEQTGSIDGADQIVVATGHTITVDAAIPNNIGSVTVNGTGIFNLVSFDLNNDGTTTVNGTLSMGSGTHLLIGSLTINTGATFNANSADISLAGNISVTGLASTTTFNEGTAVFSFVSSGVAYNITVDSDIAFDRIEHTPSDITGPRTITFTGSAGTPVITINTSFLRSNRSQGTILSSATLAYAASATLIYSPSASMSVDLDEWPTTNAPDNITKSGSTLTLGASRSVDGTFLLSSGGINVSSGTLTINGTFERRTSGSTSITGTVAYAATGSNLYYNSSSSTTIGAEWPASSPPENVTIQVTGSLSATGDVSRTIAEDLSITVGTLDLNNGTLTVSGSVAGSVVSGSAIIDPATTLLLGNGAGANQDQTISGVLTLTQMQINKSAGVGTTVSLTGSAALNFSGTSSLTVTAGTLDLNGTGRFTTAPNTLTVSSGAILRTGGTALTGVTTLSASSGTIVFSGSTQETLPTGITVGTLEVNNTNGAVTTSGTLTVNGLTLTNGIIITTSSNILALSGSVSTVGGTPSGSAMIDGPVRWTLDDNAAHTFPVGDGSNYRPASFTFNGAPNDVIQIQYLNTAPGGSLPVGISSIATGGHYILQRISGATAVNYDLTLRYTDTGFSPESRNNILVQNGTGPDYSFPSGQTRNEGTDDVTATGIGAFPTDNFRLAFGAGGVTNTWTGGTANWNLAGNWSALSIPSASDDVVIGSGVVTIQSGQTATAQSLTVQNSATLIFANTTGVNFGSGWDASQTTFATGATVQYNAGSVYVDDYVNLTINGSANTSGSGTINVSGDLVKNSSTAFSTSEAVSVTGAYTNTLGNTTYSGNLTIGGSPITGTSGTIGGTVILNGGALQTVTGASVSFANLSLNNSNGFTFSSAATISGTLTLTNGIVNNGSNAITLGSGASVSGGSDAAHIDGTVRNTGTGSKTFPVGDAGNYRPVTTNFTGSSPVVQFQAFDIAPNNSFDVSLLGISSVRHFLGSVISGSISGGSVQLSYGTDDGVSDFGETGDVVVAWSIDNSSDYTSEGGQSSGSTPSGTVTSTGGINTTLGYFTLGTVTGDNALPVELISFNAQPAFNKVLFSWSTASETENLGFNVYRKGINNSEWKKVNSSIIAGHGNTSTQNTYEFTDNSVNSGESYNYKLESVGFDGQIHVEQTLEITVPIPAQYVLFNNYPNPFNPSTTIKFQLPEGSSVSLIVYDVTGRVVKELVNDVFYNQGEYSINWDATDKFGSKVSSGLYFYRFFAGNFSKLGKMILMK